MVVMIPQVAYKALVGVLVPLLGLVWLSAEKSVTVTIDGQPELISTHATTVAEMLDRAGIAVGEADDLTPDADTPLVDGMVVELVRAREISVLMGDEEHHLVVTALSVEEVLAELGGVGRRDVVRPSRLAPVRDGMVVRVRTPVALTVTADGATREVITDATSVGDVLARLGIEVGDGDRVAPDPAATPAVGMSIVVQRVRVTEEQREVAIAHETVRRETDDLPRGEEREVRAGRDGVLQVVEEITLVDGEEEARERRHSEVLRDPVDRVVEVGTAPPPRTTSPRPATDGSPASGDDASSAPAASPTPRSTPSPSPAPRRTERSQTGEASRYADRFAGESTANGETYDPAALTAAHRTLPFGTKVKVTNRANGKQVTVRINDRGPFVEGRIIDLSRVAFESIASSSAGVIDVRITW
jgi:resuscitation-promoting factor RpfB